jgi:hypothetical protein
MLDMLTGEPGSTVILRDSPFYRYAALAVDQSILLTTSFARPARFPGNQTARALLGAAAGCSPAARADMVFQDIAIDASAAAMPAPSPQLQAGPSAHAYTVVLLNVTRECDTTPSDECLSSATPDVCLNRLNDDYQRRRRAAAASARGDSLRGGAAAGIAVGAATAAVVLMAGAGATVALRRRSKRAAKCEDEHGAVSASPQLNSKAQKGAASGAEQV